MVYRKRKKRYYDYHSDYRLYEYFGSIVADIKEHFFSLSSYSLHSLLMNYKSTYGDNAYAYAVSTYPLWRNGSRCMSDQTLLRLVETLPKFLTEEQRLHLLDKLFNDYQKRNPIQRKYISVTADWNDYVSKLESLSNDLNSIYSIYIPIDFEQDIVELASWLTNDDIRVARNILATLAVKKHKLLIASANNDIKRFYMHCENMKQKNFKNSCERLEIELPTIYITFTVKKKSFFEKLFG